MKKFLLSFALVPTIAIAANDPKACHSNIGDVERLACYDNATEYSVPAETDSATSASSPVQSAEAGKQWHVEIDGSALDDRKDVYLRVTSDEAEATGYGNTSYATLFVRCMKNSTNAFISFSSYTSDGQSVKYRLDDGPMRTVWMEPINGGDGIGIWSGARAIPFIKDLLNKEKLAVAYESYSNANLEFTFDVSGLRAKIGPLSESCGWTP
ncbi:type VI secretion system-associated protein TagO [uncultured Paracoccus sp.]|uniref:type VI secretion system-associated protein TagO n=1 Tax=uncultured Paracoccus sp. TaxID=189685 RepID=UPI00262B7295|nr:type VI secretion system-associated protein TagO [uncultured Paracoccus sp.]